MPEKTGAGDSPGPWVDKKLADLHDGLTRIWHSVCNVKEQDREKGTSDETPE